MPTARDVLLTSTSPYYRRQTVVTRDPTTGLLLIRTKQDVQPVLDQNARDRLNFNPAAHRRNAAGFVKVASVPTVVVDQLRARGIWDDHQARLRWLSSNEARHLRTDDGRRLA